MARVVPKEESRLVLRADGSWLHDGEAASHKGVARFFHSRIRRDEQGRYYLHNSFTSETGVTLEEHVYFEVEGTALFVAALRAEAGRVELELNTGERTELDEKRLVAGKDGVLECTVREGERARFTREAMAAVAPWLAEDGQGYLLRIDGRVIRVGDR